MYAEISLIRLRQCVSELYLSEVQLKHKFEKIAEIRANLRYIELDAMDELRYKLKKQMNGLESEIRKLQKLRMTLEQVIKAYERCERDIEEHEEVWYALRYFEIPHIPYVLTKWTGRLEELQIEFK